MQIPSLMFAATLLAPSTGGEPPRAPPSYGEMLAEVEALTEAINAGESVRDQLFDALAKFPRYAPLLAVDPEARAIRARAQLNLARTYLSEGANESAAGVMDEILRTTWGEALPIDEFGPSLAALYEERRAALERAGTASIEVRCEIPCRVYVNERAASHRIDDLHLGVYRLWVEPESGSGEVHSERVHLSSRDQTVTLEFRSHERAPAEIPSRARIMPRAAEIALLVVGAAAVTAGGLAIGWPGDAARGRKIAGATLTGVGGAALVLGGVSLSVDEIRFGNMHGRQAMLHWGMYF